MLESSQQNFKKTKNSLYSQSQQAFPTYKQLKTIGQGSFGKAYLVESEHDKKKYILKTIKITRQNEQMKENIFQQVKLMQNLNHIYIIKYVQSFMKGKHVCIVMEYAQNGDLEKYIQKKKKENSCFTEQQIISWFIQLCLGLKYIHERKILHRDLKADNIFINQDNQLKIGDFGVSKIMTETYDLAKTKIGTPNIMAPEIFQNMKYNQKSDIWSLGCILYKLQMLTYPFQSANIFALMAKMQSKKIEPIQGQYSQELKQLTYSLLSFEPKDRPSVHKILQTPFIKKHLSQVLQNSINKYSKTQNTSDRIKNLSQINNCGSSYKLGNKRTSIQSSLSITPTKLKNQENMSSSFQSHTSSNILQPHNSSNSQLVNIQNYQKSQNLKMIQYKQNYPILLQQNKQLKQQTKTYQANMKKFQQQTQQLLQKIDVDKQSMSKQQIIQKFRNHVLTFVYK